jgi:hypothetical protein
MTLLTTLPLSSDDLLRLLTHIIVDGDVGALQELFTMILPVSHERGHGDVLASWGKDIGRKRSFIRTS